MSARDYTDENGMVIFFFRLWRNKFNSSACVPGRSFGVDWCLSALPRRVCGEFRRRPRAMADKLRLGSRAAENLHRFK